MSAAALSLADRFRALPRAERSRRLELLDDAEAVALRYDWGWWARPNQVLPAGDWITWLILAGRGYGKTRTGAETVRQWVRQGHRFVNLIGATASDARDVLVEGESGVLAVCPRDERPQYEPSKCRLVWPNGAVSLIFSADEPERLRGKQHAKIWADELAAWRYPEAWDQAMFGLRLGAAPQTVVTTTPKPTPLIRALIADQTTLVTRGTTYENRNNLAQAFFTKVVTKYEGTRLGRQELDAEVLDDNPGALWQRASIDERRVSSAPDLVRIVVGVDPAVTSAEDSDETGIVVAGIDDACPPHYYVLDDLSLGATPAAWAQQVVRAYHLHAADRIIGETNNGGDLVEAVIRSVDPEVSYEKVVASRGKVVRAEPIAALYEQGRVHHVGAFGALEDQLCQWSPLSGEGSPDRLDALVWALTVLSGGSEPGFAAYARAQVAAAEAGEPAAQRRAAPADVPRGKTRHESDDAWTAEDEDDDA